MSIQLDRTSRNEFIRIHHKTVRILYVETVRSFYILGYSKNRPRRQQKHSRMTTTPGREIIAERESRDSSSRDSGLDLSPHCWYALELRQEFNFRRSMQKNKLHLVHPSPKNKFFKKVPFQRPQIGEEEIREVVETLRSGWLTTGVKVS